MRLLACSRSTVYRLIDEGSLRPIYFDRRPRFDPEDVAAFIESRKETSRLASGPPKCPPTSPENDGQGER